MPEFAYITQSGIEQLARDMRKSAKNAPVEFARARADLRRAANTEGKRQVSAIYNLTQQRVQKDLTVRDTAAGVMVSGTKDTISFASYGAKWSKRSAGLNYKILRKGKTFTDPQGFITNIGANKVAFLRDPKAVKRKMKSGRYEGKLRQPIHRAHGPSIADAMKDTRVSVPMRERILARTGEQLRKRLSRLRGR